MNNLSRYRKALNKLEAELPVGDIYLMSLDDEENSNNRGGSMVQVSRTNAARCLAAGTHRIATEPEIESFREAQKTAAQQIAQAELERKQPINITLGPGTVITRVEDKTEDGKGSDPKPAKK